MLLFKSKYIILGKFSINKNIQTPGEESILYLLKLSCYKIGDKHSVLFSGYYKELTRIYIKFKNCK